MKDVPFTAGEKKVLWRLQLIKFPNGHIVVELQRAGFKKLVKIRFNWKELPDVVKQLQNALTINPKGES